MSERQKERVSERGGESAGCVCEHEMEGESDRRFIPAFPLLASGADVDDLLPHNRQGWRQGAAVLLHTAGNGGGLSVQGCENPWPQERRWREEEVRARVPKGH